MARPKQTSVDKGALLDPMEEENISSSCCQNWFEEAVWPGLGLFGESYLLFSIGTLKPFWEILFPDCYAGESCNPSLLHSLTFSVVIGIMVGMVTLGYLANSLGRRQGSILTASFMAFGGWGLTLITLVLASSPVWLFRSMSTMLFIFGVGVGGEYPLAASSASERAMGDMQKRMAMELEREQTHGYAELDDNDDVPKLRHHEEQQHRGSKIQLVFSMQGMGVMANSVVMTALLMLMGQTHAQGYDTTALLMIWRITYAFGASILSYVLTSRIAHLTESKVWQDDKERRAQIAKETLMSSAVHHQATDIFQHLPLSAAPSPSNVSSLSNPSVAILTPKVEQDYSSMLQQVPSTDGEEDKRASRSALLLRNYGIRLIGASMSWLLWDIAFYGNKLFQSTFLLALTGDETTLLEFVLASSLNSAVALIGYFGAAALLDRVGRYNLQFYGFFVTGIMFVSCAFLSEQLNPSALVALYLGSSFFGQLGPNATTFLIPAEIFPTEMRTMCHGICAASGKAGALIAAILFNHMENMDLFLLSGYASFAACVITFWTIPETLGLDLYEIDRKWRMILEGRKGDYNGNANHPDFMSRYERSKLGLHH